MEFKGRDIININDLTVEEITYILDVAERMLPAARGEQAVELTPNRILAYCELSVIICLE